MTEQTVRQLISDISRANRTAEGKIEYLCQQDDALITILFWQASPGPRTDGVLWKCSIGYGLSRNDHWLRSESEQLIDKEMPIEAFIEHLRQALEGFQTPLVIAPVQY